jgi:hypothetical protein
MNYGTSTQPFDSSSTSESLRSPSPLGEARQAASRLAQRP